MKIWKDGIVRDMTDEELAELNEENPTEESEVEENAGTF